MVIPPNQNAGYTLVGMFILLILMDFLYYNKHFEGPQAALKTSIDEIIRKEKELEGSTIVGSKLNKNM